MAAKQRQKTRVAGNIKTVVHQNMFLFPFPDEPVIRKGYDVSNLAMTVSVLCLVLAVLTAFGAFMGVVFGVAWLIVEKPCIALTAAGTVVAIAALCWIWPKKIQ